MGALPKELGYVLDAHVHLRQKDVLKAILDWFKYCDAVVAIGNTDPPIINKASLIEYKKEIEQYNPPFDIIYSIMLVNSTTPHVVEAAYDAGARVIKLIPGGTSTNSDHGVALERLINYYEVLKRARELGMIFSIHLELVRDENGNEIPEIAREEAAIPYLKKLVDDIPGLRIVVEHASTAALIEVVKSMPANVAATLTPHHATITIDDVMKNGEIINPHYYCKPIAKTEADRLAVVEAMTSGNPKFIFGSDSAAHPDEKKLAQPPAAGIFSAPVVMALLWDTFVKARKEEFFDNFVGIYGARFYGLPTTIKKPKSEIIETPWTVPDHIFSNRKEFPITIFMAGEKLPFFLIEC